MRVILHMQGGSRHVWLVRPKQQMVTVFSQNEPEHILTMENTLDGGDVLPGFSLPVRALFQHP